MTEVDNTITVEFNLSSGKCYSCEDLTKAEAKEIMDSFMCDRSKLIVVEDKKNQLSIIIVKEHILLVRCTKGIVDG